MTTWQKILKYIVAAFACFLCLSIVGGIISVISVFSGVFGIKNKEVRDMTEYPVISDITKVKIDTGTMNFSVKISNDFRIETNNEDIIIKENNGELKIYEENRFLFGGLRSAEIKLCIYIPSDKVFEQFCFDGGTGNVDIEGLSADRVDFDFGTGDVNINNLNTASEAKINGGTGKITVHNSRLANADIDMGVGEMNLTGEFYGKSRMDLGVGAVRINLMGNKEDYCINVEKGLGSVAIDGQKMSDGSVYGNGDNKIKLDGGVGAIRVNFTE